MSTEAEIAVLAQHFFDCAESGDVDGLIACYADGARIWHNTDEAEQTPAENAVTLRGFVKHIPSREYSDRRLRVFPGGFVQQHVLRGVRQDGVRVALPACIVCQVAAGKITRLDEYFDSARVAEFVK